MKASRWLTAVGPALLAGLLVALAVGGALLTYVSTRPSEYQARFALVATSSGRAQPGQVDLGTLVSLTLPSLTELARAPVVLVNVVKGIPGAPSISQLSGDITVELVPASGVARITVDSHSAVLASRLASALSADIRSLNLLAPVGTYRAFGPGASDADRRTAPDRLLGGGFAIVAAVIAGLLIASLYAARRPRIVSRRQVSGIINEPGLPVILLNGGRSSSDQIVDALGPVGGELIAVGLKSQKAADAVRVRLKKSGEIPPGGGVDGVILVVALGRTTPDDLTNHWSALVASKRPVSAVVLA